MKEMARNRLGSALIFFLEIAVGFAVLGCPAPMDHSPGEQPRETSGALKKAAPTLTEPVAEAELPQDKTAAILRTAKLSEAMPEGSAGRTMIQIAPVHLRSPERLSAWMSPALIDAPNTYKRTLAYYELAKALQIASVPVSVKRAVNAGELVSLLETMPDSGVLGWPPKEQLAILNDGSVDVLLSSPGPQDDPFRLPAGSVVVVAGGAGTASLQRWAAAEMPLPDEQTPLLRSYIEMLALDFLAANVVRKTAQNDSLSGRLLLIDNGDAFPDTAEPEALSPLLSSLSACARFPRTLRDNLKRLTPERVRALFLSGPFENWLISPRNAVLLSERRNSLLSLIEAKINAKTTAGQGSAAEASVLSL